MPLNIKHTLKRFKSVEQKRRQWESHWQEVSDYVLPRRADFQTQRTRGQKRNTNLYDATAVQANEQLASALHSMLTSPHQPWFQLTTGNPAIDRDNAVKTWLQQSADRMHQVLEASNFHTEADELYLDLGSVGTGFMMCLEDDEKVVRFHTRHLSEAYFIENAQGVIDEMFRKFPMTLQQIDDRWGVPENMKKHVENTPDDERKILHYIYPRRMRDKSKKDNKNMPWASVYILLDQELMLEETGYPEWPAMTPRWTKASGEVYGRSPGMKALPDIKMVNKMSKTIIAAAEKVVDPPLLAPDDGIVSPVRTLPGGLTYYRAGQLSPGDEPIKPIITGADVGLGLEMEEQRRLHIRQMFYNDQLQLSQGPDMTATEVVQRTEDRLRQLGPVLGRLHSEFLRPLITRVFGICLRAGVIPRAPAIIQETGVDVMYISPIAKAQRATEAQGFLRFMQIMSPLGEVQPEIWDKVDGDEVSDGVASLMNMPAKWLRGEREIEKIRQARNEQLQQREQKEDLLDAATIAAQSGGRQ